MKNLIHRILDALLPWRRTIASMEFLTRKQEEGINRLRSEVNDLLTERAHLTRERDTALRQMRETVSVNLHNAAAHRATEVAMLRQNHALQAAEARLAGKPVHPLLAAAAKEVPALAVPKRIPVQQPKLKSHHE